MENIFILIFGIFVSAIGIINMTGNISTIHGYNRRRVREEDVPAYGMAMGIGTLIIGVTVVIDFVLTVLALAYVVPFITIPAVVAGLGFMLYAQFKYNGGIF